MPLFLIAAVAKLKGLNWRALLIACGVLLSAFLIWSYLDTRQANIDLQRSLSASQAEVQALQTQKAASDHAVATRNTLLESLATMETTERAQTVKAIEANPDWAKQPIPADVLASLRK